MTGAAFEALMADLERALSELTTVASPDAWSRGKPGKWSAGQHVDHIRVCMAEAATEYETRAATLRAGALAPVPKRGLLESLWVDLVIRRGRLPRGGRTPQRLEAGSHPDRDATLAGLREARDRHDALGRSLEPEEQDRLWAPNPFLPKWRYTLPEILRVHAVHARHHAKQIIEAE